MIGDPTFSSPTACDNAQQWPGQLMGGVAERGEQHSMVAAGSRGGGQREGEVARLVVATEELNRSASFKKRKFRREGERRAMRWLVLIFLAGYLLGRYVEEPILLRLLQASLMAALGVVGLLMNIPSTEENEAMTVLERAKARALMLPERISAFVPGAYSLAVTMRSSNEERGQILEHLGDILPVVPELLSQYDLLWPHMPALLRNVEHILPHTKELLAETHDERLAADLPLLLANLDALAPHIGTLLEDKEVYIAVLPQLKPALPLLLEGDTLEELLDDEATRKGLLKNMQKILPHLQEVLPHVPVLLKHKQLLRPPTVDALLSHIGVLLPRAEQLLELVDVVEPHLQVLMENFDALAEHLDEILQMKAVILEHADVLMQASVLEPLLKYLPSVLQYYPQLEPHLDVILAPGGVVLDLLTEHMEFFIANLPYLCANIGGLLDPQLLAALAPHFHDVKEAFPELRDHIGLLLNKPEVRGAILPHLDVLLPKRHLLLPHIDELLSDSVRPYVLRNANLLLAPGGSSETILENVGLLLKNKAHLLPCIDILLGSLDTLTPILPLVFPSKEKKEESDSGKKATTEWQDALTAEFTSSPSHHAQLAISPRSSPHNNGGWPRKGPEEEDLFSLMAPHTEILLRYLDRLVAGVLKMSKNGDQEAARKKLRVLLTHMDLVAPALSEILVFWDVIVDNMDLIVQIIHDLDGRVVTVKTTALATTAKKESARFASTALILASDSSEESELSASDGLAYRRRQSVALPERALSTAVVDRAKRHKHETPSKHADGARSPPLGRQSHLNSGLASPEATHHHPRRAKSVAVVEKRHTDKGGMEKRRHSPEKALAVVDAKNLDGGQRKPSVKEVPAIQFLVETAVKYKEQILPHLHLLSSIYGSGKVNVEALLTLMQHSDSLIPYLKQVTPYLPVIVPQLQPLVEQRFDVVWPLLEEYFDDILAAKGLDALMEDLPLVVAHLPLVVKHIELLIPRLPKILANGEALHQLLLYAEYLLPFTEELLPFADDYLEEFIPYIHILAPRIEKIAPHAAAIYPHMDKVIPHLDEFVTHIDTLIPMMGDTVAHMDSLLENFGWLLKRWHGLLEFESVVSKLPAVGNLLGGNEGGGDGSNILARFVRSATEKLKPNEEPQPNSPPQSTAQNLLNRIRPGVQSRNAGAK